MERNSQESGNIFLMYMLGTSFYILLLIFGYFLLLYVHSKLTTFHLYYAKNVYIKLLDVKQEVSICVIL